MLRRSFQRRLPAAALVLIAGVLVLVATRFLAGGAPADRGQVLPTAAHLATAAQLQGHVRFADNAGSVDGFKASSSPRPKQLLALGRNRKFPASVLPMGATGPRGPAGPPGAAGANAVTSDSLTTSPQVNNGDNPANPASGSVICKAGRVVGGGYIDETGAHPGSFDEVEQDAPVTHSDGTSGWFVQMTNVPQALGAGGSAGPAQVAVYFQVYVLCLS